MKLNLSIPQELVEKTKCFATKIGGTLSGVVRVSLEKHLEENESKNKKEA